MSSEGASQHVQHGLPEDEQVHERLLGIRRGGKQRHLRTVDCGWGLWWKSVGLMTAYLYELNFIQFVAGQRRPSGKDHP